ncbi:MAG: VOC family protein [bacterium]|nr:VOC family protein [bacterium]
MNKVFAWIDIPVANMERAAEFYGRLLNRDLVVGDIPPRRMATLYFEQGEVGGSLVESPGFNPGSEGTHVYLNAGRGDDLDAMIARVVELGGEIIIPRTPMGNAGHFASFKDSEGNLLSLFAEK